MISEDRIMCQHKSGKVNFLDVIELQGYFSKPDKYRVFTRNKVYF